MANVESLSQLAELAERITNAGASRKLFNAIAEGSVESVKGQRVDTLLAKGAAIATLETTDTKGWSTAGKKAHAELLESVKTL